MKVMRCRLKVLLAERDMTQRDLIAKIKKPDSGIEDMKSDFEKLEQKTDKLIQLLGQNSSLWRNYTLPDMWSLIIIDTVIWFILWN